MLLKTGCGTRYHSRNENAICSLASIPFSPIQPATLTNGLALRSTDDENNDIVIPKVDHMWNFNLTSLCK